MKKFIIRIEHAVMQFILKVYKKVKFNANLSYFSDFEEGDPSAPYQEKKEQLPF